MLPDANEQKTFTQIIICSLKKSLKMSYSLENVNYEKKKIEEQIFTLD